MYTTYMYMYMYVYVYSICLHIYNTGIIVYISILYRDYHHLGSGGPPDSRLHMGKPWMGQYFKL